MPAIGKNHPLVMLIHKKTKVKIPDIIDILKSMDECIPEAFLSQDLAPKERFSIGGMYLFWKHSKTAGSTILIKPSDTFRKNLTTLKLQKRTPLASLLFNLMTPFNKNRALIRAKRLTLLNVSK